MTNGYLVDCGSSRVLFDAPEGVTDWLKSRGRSIDLLILTHQHVDHVLDAAALVKTFECPVWAHSDLDDGLTLAPLLAAITGECLDIAFFSVSRHLEDGEVISIGERSFSVLHIPGHSPDSLCFYEKEAGFVIGGDVLFRSGIGRTDFPHGNHRQLIQGIREKLWPLPETTTVYPGHGSETTIGLEKVSNPFVR